MRLSLAKTTTAPMTTTTTTTIFLGCDTIEINLVINNNSNMKKTSNMKTTSIRANQDKSTKPNLLNQVYQTERNLPKELKQSSKINS